MWSSRDVAIIVGLAVVNLVFSALAGQLGWLTTGMPGSNLVIFGIVYALFVSFALLIFEGKRWKFFVQSILIVMILFPHTLMVHLLMSSAEFQS